MKYLITVIISLLAVQAFAETKAYAGLKKGGEIVLTKDRCASDEAKQRAYWYDKEGTTVDGCWAADGRTIYFEWDNGTKSRYPQKRFKVVDSW